LWRLSAETWCDHDCRPSPMGAAQADIATNLHYLRQIAANTVETVANTERTVGFFEHITNRQREPEVRTPAAPRV
jgi:hypothetical protein